MGKKSDKLPVKSNDVDSFLKKVEQVKSLTTYGNPAGKLAFIIDATASRQPTWDYASKIQSSMFSAAEESGSLNVQLIYFRGISEFYVSPWNNDSKALQREMADVLCMTGHTQIEQSLNQVLFETRRAHISAAVYIGDACEEPVNKIYKIAGELGLHKTPVFMFQEYDDQNVEAIYREIARLTGGAYSRFDINSPGILKELLSAVAIYAAGGSQALKLFAGKGTAQLQEMTRQLLK
ncbi:MAG: VWA domain-containing protein [Gammaproteobacteria bacterium]|nr:VWA domain-containing protein [Gammaproteobacteria bacterium]